MIQPTGEVETVHQGFDFTEGPAWDPRGVLYFSDIPNTTIHRLVDDDKLSKFTADSKHTNGIMVAADGRILACQMDGQVVSYDVDSAKATVLADSFQGKRFNAPNDLVIDESGGIYFTDPLFRAAEPLPQGVQAVYYISAAGEVSRVTDHIAAPNGIGLSPDGKQLYVAPSRQAEMLVYDVDGPGKLSGGRTLCRLKQPEGKDDTGGDGMAVDVEGNLYFTTNLGVEIFSQRRSAPWTCHVPRATSQRHPGRPGRNDDVRYRQNGTLPSSHADRRLETELSRPCRASTLQVQLGPVRGHVGLLPGAHAAIDQQRLTVDVLGGVGQQEDGGAGTHIRPREPDRWACAVSSKSPSVSLDSKRQSAAFAPSLEPSR